MEKKFKAAYKQLNDAQRRAVDTIDGPLLVLAGPGTGKTELLSIRVANILNRTDMTAGNILCLTFTESAQANMQARLGKLIGPLASRVGVHTFHGFGSHIIGTHGDYFQEAFGFRPSDDVTRYQLLADILERLPRDVRLSSMYDGQFLYLKDIQMRISQLKQAGIAPAEFKKQVSQDQIWVKTANKVLLKHLGSIDRIGAKHLPNFEALAASLESLTSVEKSSVPALGDWASTELNGALEEAENKNTKPLTAWKNRWLSKNGERQFIFTASRQLSKLAELASIYQSYQQQLKDQRLYDYDDMIMRVIEVVKSSDSLRAELQEQYQYILVDEYQDTNGAQLRLLKLLAESPINEGKPNLMVVGDDDQAIYGFQGAYHSNVLDFLESWPAARKEVLTINYRSTAPILDLARQIIVQGEDRLENSQADISKELTAEDQSKAPKPRVEILTSEVEQFGWLAGQVQKAIKERQDPRQIAIIAPKHKYLEALVPYLQARNIPVAYERREDVLQQPHVTQLLQLARSIAYLARGDIEMANQLLPELMSYPWWHVETGWLWELALEAKKTGNTWLDLMLASRRARLKTIAKWLLEQARASQSNPLEPMMDTLMGPAEPTKHFVSPYRHYYFGHDSAQDSVTYLRLLSGLISLRSALRQYKPHGRSTLADFIDFADLRLQADLPLRNDHPLVLDTAAVQLMTVHKAKGLEFESVYLLNVNEHTWQKERGRTSNIALPPSYEAMAPAGTTSDEKLRLFYVALTRARKNLTLTNFATNNEGQATLPLGRLQPDAVQASLDVAEPENHPKQPAKELTRQLSFDWLTPHFELRTKAPWRALLQADMENYRLSPTHLNAFLDVSRGGPKAFLVNQLLRFPQAMSVNAQFGDVMHAILQRLHGYYNEHRKLPGRPLADKWLDEIIADYYFGPIEEPKAQRRGRMSLDGIYEQLSSSFRSTQMAEYSFAGEGVVAGEARLKGIIDNLELDKTAKSATIIDYKTGKAVTKWPATEAADYAAARAHNYKQQLLFYKLLVENSRRFNGYTASLGRLQFVEPDEEGNLKQLELAYSAEEVDKLKRLIGVVYKRIITLDFPDTSHYKNDLQGIKAFENDLLTHKI